ncbi:glycoside hydrolase [Phaeosphaeria sp. MPI-PUGE-AT-0046c]|nr:glycoside hydrolase [Phaeosphaeria sp. MPI-PUGE-AT-0046c]
MFARKSALTIVFPLFFRQILGQSGLQLEVESQESIKSVAKSLTGGLIAAYNEELKENGVPGLFGGDTYWWEAGTVWNAIAEYSYLTGDHQYDETISEALQWQLGEYDAYMPANQTKTLGNDDQSCWGLAAMTAAEVGLAKPKNAEWADYAVNVWNTQNSRLESEEGTNGTCGGGLRWQIFTFNNGYNYKNSFTNGNFFLLSARLAKFTGNTTYLQTADKVFKWSQDVGLVSKDFHVYDGTSTTENCTNIAPIQWTSNVGVYAEGAALMSNITSAQKWTDAVKSFVNSSSIFMSNGSNIITEVACERSGKCNIDQRAFKGIFARTMARTAVASPWMADTINEVLKVNAKAAAGACENAGNPKCSSWAAASKGGRKTAADGNIGEVFSALEVIQGLLYPSAKGMITANGSSGGNMTQNGGASSVSGTGAPQATGAAASIASSMMAVFAIAFATALSL